MGSRRSGGMNPHSCDSFREIHGPVQSYLLIWTHSSFRGKEVWLDRAVKDTQGGWAHTSLSIAEYLTLWRMETKLHHQSNANSNRKERTIPLLTDTSCKTLRWGCPHLPKLALHCPHYSVPFWPLFLLSASPPAPDFFPGLHLCLSKIESLTESGSHWLVQSICIEQNSRTRPINSYLVSFMDNAPFLQDSRGQILGDANQSLFCYQKS